MSTNSHKYLDTNTFRGKFYLSVEMSILVWVCFMIGFLLTPGHGDMVIISGLWCAISGIIVLQDTRRKTIHSAFVRIAGSLLGAVIGGFFLTVFSPSFWLITPMVFISAIFCKLFNFEEGMRLAVLTTAIIFAVSYIGPDISGVTNATYRFIESAIGTGLALFIRWGSLEIITRLSHRKAK
ncbi:FUSC family protein [Francisellaceae bacterium]|nr:FUSC family protein [Francisellaceae bacterium]